MSEDQTTGKVSPTDSNPIGIGGGFIFIYRRFVCRGSLPPCVPSNYRKRNVGYKK